MKKTYILFSVLTMPLISHGLFADDIPLPPDYQTTIPFSKPHTQKDVSCVTGESDILDVSFTVSSDNQSMVLTVKGLKSGGEDQVACVFAKNKNPFYLQSFKVK